jgi:invasion protein IalB
MATQYWHPEVQEDDRKRAPGKRRRVVSLASFVLAIVLLLLLNCAGLAFAWYAGYLSLPGLTALTAAPSPVPAAAPPQQSTAAAPAATPAQPPLKVLSQEPIGDWIHVCVELPNAQGQRCGITQQLNHAETGRAMFQWRITQESSGGFIGEWETPTGLVVGRGILFDAGTEKPVAIPFQACTQTGCMAVANLAPDFVEALMRTERVSATVVPIGGKPVKLALSAKGLKQGLLAIGAKQAEATQPATAQ